MERHIILKIKTDEHGECADDCPTISAYRPHGCIFNGDRDACRAAELAINPDVIKKAKNEQRKCNECCALCLRDDCDNDCFALTEIIDELLAIDAKIGKSGVE